MKYFFIIILSLLCFSNVHADSIRVLIMDGDFLQVPEKEEKLALLDNVKGDLLVKNIHYTGQIEVWRGERGLYLINELPLEEYVRHVVKAETTVDWDMEALKAQAVITRTYAIYNKGKSNGLSKFDLTSSVLHQVYRGNASDVRVSYAVKTTEGEILTYGGKPVEAFYHSTCGETTESPEEVFSYSLPYLKSVECSSSLSPYALWARRIPLEDIQEALNLNEGIDDILISSHTSTGRVKELDVVAGSVTRSFKATELRKMLGWQRLPSTNFSIKVEDGCALFEGKGYGHGVGLCQWSSLYMARQGKSYKEILSYFYPGTALLLYENSGF